ncbi:MAG: cytochrome c family protein [Acidobacteriia bacterium]|nr:cytochrome c family protein [Terriglobia bacterium]
MRGIRGEWAVRVVAQMTAVVALAVCGAAAQQAPAGAPVVSTTKQEALRKALETPGPVQPIAYSHKKHLAMGLSCDFCHTNPDPGVLMKFPETAKCMSCHATVAKNKPEIRKLADYAKTQQAIPWVRVYVVLKGVNWSHRPHLKAGTKCETCHGAVDQLDVMARVTGVTAMFGCIDCHEQRGAKAACETCHKPLKIGN